MRKGRRPRWPSALSRSYRTPEGWNGEGRKEEGEARARAPADDVLHDRRGAAPDGAARGVRRPRGVGVGPPPRRGGARAAGRARAAYAQRITAAPRKAGQPMERKT